MLFSRFLRTLSTNMSAAKKVLVLLAEGAEEMETVVTVDILRRAELNVTLAGLSGGDVVRCSRNVQVKPDCALDSVADQTDFACVVLPGGAKGAQNLAESALVGSLLTAQHARGGWIAAICAAPLALKAHRIALGTQTRITSYPSVREQVADAYTYVDDANVCVDEAAHLLTSRGPGTTFEFALKIAELLVGKQVADKVQSGALVKF